MRDRMSDADARSVGPRIENGVEGVGGAAAGVRGGADNASSGAGGNRAADIGVATSMSVLFCIFSFF